MKVELAHEFPQTPALAPVRKWRFGPLVFGIALVCVVPLVAEEKKATSQPPAAKVLSAVQRLGADQFVVREDATVELYELGREGDLTLVMQALEKAVKTSDREVQERARRVLALLREQRREELLQQFLAGQDTPEVPGWNLFAKRIGDTKAARRVYAELLGSEWELLELCLQPSAKGQPTAVNQLAPTGPPAIRAMTQERFTQLLMLRGSYESLPLGSVQAFFFLSIEYPNDVALHRQLLHLVSASLPLAQRIGASGDQGLDDPITTTQGVTRRLVSEWLQATVRHHQAYEASILAVTLRSRLFAEAKALSTQILKNDGSSPVTKKLAMETFAVLRDHTGVPLIEAYLKDETSLRRGTKRLQLRDIALTCLMDLNGHDLAKIDVRRSSVPLQSPYDYNSLGFESEEARAQAFQTYTELQAEKKFQEEKQKRQDEGQR